MSETRELTPNAIVKKSLKEQVHDLLYGKIISGECAPGERLKIIPIARALNVSQAPVREALQCLITSGYLERLPNGGVQVKQYSDSELHEVYQLRKILETGALREAGRKCSELRSVLEPHLQKMREAADENDPMKYALYDTKFHRGIVESAGNEKMLSIWDSLLVPKHIIGTIKHKGKNLADVVPLHLPIVENLRKCDVDAVERSLAHHYEVLKR
ncbi:MAG: GntR family transcriptional regulator [Desulfovibrio sp.]|jgi:DNA-binding GntR family transcriptional regulator|nr:GntR family transcriptional regulator [Desulfovibrio sp.]